MGECFSFLLIATLALTACDPSQLPASDTASSADDAVTGLRIGLDESYVQRAHPEVAEAVLVAASVLENQGAELVEVDLSWEVPDVFVSVPFEPDP